MTQEQIDRVKKAYREKEETHAKAKMASTAFYDVLTETRKICDHRQADGKSAVFGGFEYSSCDICGELF